MFITLGKSCHPWQHDSWYLSLQNNTPVVRLFSCGIDSDFKHNHKSLCWSVKESQRIYLLKGILLRYKLLLLPLDITVKTYWLRCQLAFQRVNNHVTSEFCFRMAKEHYKIWPHRSIRAGSQSFVWFCYRVWILCKDIEGLWQDFKKSGGFFQARVMITHPLFLFGPLSFSLQQLVQCWGPSQPSVKALPARTTSAHKLSKSMLTGTKEIAKAQVWAVCWGQVASRKWCLVNTGVYMHLGWEGLPPFPAPDSRPSSLRLPCLLIYPLTVAMCPDPPLLTGLPASLLFLGQCHRHYWVPGASFSPFRPQTRS